ncbi:hypothetical protein SUGI_1520720 [Cryptomeria japonica]|uniref:Catalase n=1 Tax=Cryptomeria japonica TaxID=3369 RepID=A0AAD3NTQ4_CRYJA|nr:uncharacterized protein LOC131873495 [Cryptomeria japonica]GLJ59719.1 hypothetical protein SUGI_1520720 [Cryptomeria japonica]
MDPQAPSDPSQVKITTLKSGAPNGDKLNSLLLGPKGLNLLADVAYLEENAHFNRERIPERVVHAKGAAALGKFVVTNTEITKYCQASLFNEIGKTTPVVARFSHVTGESGISDTARDVRGFAVKFRTEQGNWDIVGNNLPVFFIRDPINFPSFIHSQKRNPQTHLRDPNAFWDFVSLLPETLHTILMLFSDRGTPDGFRHMHGFGVNTFKLVGANPQRASYAKFHWICDQGIRNLDAMTAVNLAGEDPDYSLRDLFVNIERGNFPSWTLKFQVISLDDASKVDFNIFDDTKTWPHAKFPLIEIGKMTLNKNVDNYFAQVEQLAFSPANMVLGIQPSPDKMLTGRIFAYTDAQRYRLGANFYDLPCNKPLCPVMAPTYCDGVTFMSNLPGSLPNYVPSIKYNNLSLRNELYLEHPQHFSGQVGRYDLSKDDNYSQPRILVTKVLNKEKRAILVSNIADHLKLVTMREITGKVLMHFREIDAEFASAIESAMKATPVQ